MKTNTVIVKELDKQIKQNEKQLKMSEDYLSTSEKAVNQESAKLSKQGYSTSLLKEYVDIAKNANNNLSTVEEISKYKNKLTVMDLKYPDFKLLGNYVKDYMKYKNDVDTYTTNIKKLETEKEKLQNSDNDGKQLTEEDVPKADGHLYPVALVVKCTNKLKYWNNLLDKYIEKVENTDVNVNLTWLLKKIEWLCRKINYGLAMLRYYIVKSMGALYQKIQDNIPPLKILTSINVADLPSVVNLGKCIIDFFTKPYKVLVDFVVDFATYTPPLVSNAATLVGKTATVPVKWLGMINFVAEDKESGEQKHLAEVYKQYINLKMESISLTDLKNSSSEKKPGMAEFSGNKAQYDNLSQEADIIDSQTEQAWRDFINSINSTYNSFNGRVPYIRARYIEKINWIVQNVINPYYIEANYNKEMMWNEIGQIVYEQEKLNSKLEKAKQKAVEKAEEAQKKAEKARKAAEKRDQAAAAHILDDEIVREAEESLAEANKAKAEADKALQEANSIDTTADIPWGTIFNSTKYPVYAYISSETLPSELADGMQYLSNLKDSLIAYYDSMYGPKTSGRTTSKLQPYVDFIKTFSSVYPCVDELLATLADCSNAKKHVTEEMNKLNRRSIFK